MPKDVSQKKARKTATIRPLVIRQIPREEQLEYLEEARKDALEKRLLNRLLIEKRKLEDRISNPVRLIERISLPGPSQSDYIPPAPIPKDLHFIKSKTIKRCEDLFIVLNAVRANLDPLFEELKKDEDLEKISIEVRDNLWDWYEEIQEIGLRSKWEWEKYSNKEWRYLFGSLKQLKTVSCKNPRDNLESICKELRGLNINIPRKE